MPPPEIRDASTVLLVRERDQGGIELFLTQRPDSMVFLGGFHVFPGGRVDAADADSTAVARCTGLTADNAQAALGHARSPEQSLAYYTAAVRELFEEVGILLAYHENRPVGDLFASSEGPDLNAVRESLEAKEQTFAEFLAAHSLTYALDQLRYFSHWITPPGPPRRFDTRFFLAQLPADQTPTPHKREVAASVWISPTEALERQQAGTKKLIPPTIASLRTLTEYPDLSALFAAFPA